MSKRKVRHTPEQIVREPRRAYVLRRHAEDLLHQVVESCLRAFLNASQDLDGEN